MIALQAPSLPTVSLVIADTETYTLANNAIHHSVSAYPFSSVLIFTDRPEFWPQYKTISIPKIRTIDDYNRIIIEDLANALETDFALIVQYDGFIINPDQFSKNFFSFDYIGAVWGEYPEYRVGNGGFSWRSRRLIKAAQAYASLRKENMAEDLFICRQIRPILESQYDCRFADEETAHQFSYEIIPTNRQTFGFHGLFNLIQIYQPNPEFLIRNLPNRIIENRLGLLLFGIERLPPEERQIYLTLLRARIAQKNK